MTVAETAASHWDGRIIRILGDRENHVYEMAVPSGRAALRLHRAGYQSSAAIRSELWWCDQLSRAGLPIPAALAPQGGGLLVPLDDGRHASAIAWLEGEALGEAGLFPRPLTDVLAQYHALGQLLARLHQTTDGLVLPADFTRPRWDRDGLVGETPFWGRFWDHPAATPDQRRVLIRARDLLRERLTGLKTGLIHADVLHENVLVNDHLVSLIDFDDSGFGFRLYDLGTALIQTVYHAEQPEIRAALMAGYGTSDLQMVETFTLARTLASVGWTMPRLAPDDPIHRSHLARAVMCAEGLLT
jgi:Ser/Thr protein kinase RdoA (MazF antagonist)